MSLENILGRTAEIRIIDFLAENSSNSYTQWEIFELTGISRNILYKKLPEMVEKNILEIDGHVGRHRTYKLAGNEFVSRLISSVYEYNRIEAEKPEGVGAGITPEPVVKSENRYYRSPDIVPDDVPVIPQVKEEIALPIDIEAAKKLLMSLQDAIAKDERAHTGR